MNLKKYEVFLKVVELRSFTKAADALQCTQSGVSQAIAGLEEEMGFPLLRRSRGGVRLSADGERVLPLVTAIVEQCRRLDALCASIHGGEGGLVRIGAFSSVAVHWLPGILRDFQSAHPGVEFKLLTGDYHDVEQWLRDGDADLGFVTLPADLDCPCTPLYEDELMAVLPRSHPLAGAPGFPVRRFADEPFLSLLETSDHDARRTLEAAGVKPEIKFTTKDDYAIIAMVESGLGVTLMPQLLLKGASSGAAVLPLEPRACRTIALARPEASARRLIVNRLAEFICDWVQKQYV